MNRKKRQLEIRRKLPDLCAVNNVPSEDNEADHEQLKLHIAIKEQEIPECLEYQTNLDSLLASMLTLNKFPV